MSGMLSLTGWCNDKNGEVMLRIIGGSQFWFKVLAELMVTKHKSIFLYCLDVVLF
jgi:hypothetical protein